jgi:hypothetical protein
MLLASLSWHPQIQSFGGGSPGATQASVPARVHARIPREPAPVHDLAFDLWGKFSLQQQANGLEQHFGLGFTLETGYGLWRDVLQQG